MANAENLAWHLRHVAAMHNPKGFERAIVGLLKAWYLYAELHLGRYESRIGEDGVLGPQWADIGKAILELLNGETGRLDCGALDGEIRDMLRREGFPTDS